MIKNIYLRIFPLIFFLCFTHVLPGQSRGSVQRFSWEESELVLRYEVVIEQEENGRYQSLLREFTNSASLELSLSPGNYRMRVILHDIRDMPVGETDWRTFQVLAPAPEPTPEPFALIEEPEEPVIDPVIQIDEPEIITQTEEPEQETQPEEIERIKKDLPFKMYASAAWMPFIPVYEGEGDIFDNKSSFAGAAVRFGMVFDKEFMNLNPGLDLAVSWYSAGGDQTITATLNFLAQKRLNNIVAVNFRFGAGYTVLPNRETQASTEQLIQTNLGVSFLWLAFDPFFIEAGFDYTHYFTNYVSGCLRPWIGFGIKF